GVLVDDALEARALVAAEGREPRHLDQIGNARAVVLLDQAVELEERAGERLREHLAERGLAGPTQPDEPDPARAIAGVIRAGAALDQLGDGGELGLRQAPDQVENLRHGRAPS